MLADEQYYTPNGKSFTCIPRTYIARFFTSRRRRIEDDGDYIGAQYSRRVPALVPHHSQQQQHVVQSIVREQHPNSRRNLKNCFDCRLYVTLRRDFKCTVSRLLSVLRIALEFCCIRCAGLRWVKTYRFSFQFFGVWYVKVLGHSRIYFNLIQCCENGCLHNRRTCWFVVQLDIHKKTLSGAE